MRKASPKERRGEQLKLDKHILAFVLLAKLFSSKNGKEKISELALGSRSVWDDRARTLTLTHRN